MKDNIKGITLVALIITIIILLILAGISIRMITGNTGLLSKAQIASDETEKSQATETMNLKITTAQINYYAESQKLPSLQYLADTLCEDDDMEYVLTSSKAHATLDKIDTTNISSIYTKLKKYPYEFEINSSLQLASVDGIKVAQSTNNNCNHISTVIDEFLPEIVEVNGTYITVNIPETTKTQAKVYIFLLNGNVMGCSSDGIYTYTNLQLATSYNISIIAMDTTGKLKTSIEKNVSTLDKQYLFKNGIEYAYLTGGYEELSEIKYNGVTTGTAICTNENDIYKIQFTSNNNSNGYGGNANIQTRKLINKQTFSKLIVEYNYSTTDNYTRDIIILKNLGNSDLYKYSLPAKSIKNNEKQSIDLNTINSDFYIKLNAGAVLRC